MTKRTLPVARRPVVRPRASRQSAPRPEPSGPIRGTVEAVRADGDVVVQANGRTFSCDVLRTSEGIGFRLAPGAQVICLGPEPGESRGVIVGRVERYDPEEGRRVTISADEEVNLVCGEGSVRVRSDGKVTTRGVDVVNSAKRRMRIKGGSVDIN